MHFIYVDPSSFKQPSFASVFRFVSQVGWVGAASTSKRPLSSKVTTFCNSAAREEMIEEEAKMLADPPSLIQIQLSTQSPPELKQQVWKQKARNKSSPEAVLFE